MRNNGKHVYTGWAKTAKLS